MRGFMSYLVAGVLVVLAMDMIAPPVGLGLSVGAWPAIESNTSVQIVNRSSKGDRLLMPAAVKAPAPIQRPSMMVGCDPAFSPLSASAHYNFAARCVA